MRIGFTGTQNGMSDQQVAQLRLLFESFSLRISEFHHGDCIGADEEAHGLALPTLGIQKIWVHPPTCDKKRAFCQSPNILEPAEYIARNHHIVDATDILIAAPQHIVETVRSGTWATVRYARKINKPYFLLKP